MKRGGREIVHRLPQSDFDTDEFKIDCPDYPLMPTVLPARKRIIAIGDIHGDLELAVKSLKLAKIIDDKLNWIANPSDTVVVQVGDQVDSCRPVPGRDCHNVKMEGDLPEDMKVIDLFNDLHKKAMKVGGAVYSLLGNHEIMNSEGDFRYVSKANHSEFEYETAKKKYVGMEGRRESFKPGGEVACMLACSRNTAMIIGSNMFIHAGVLPELVDRIGDVEAGDYNAIASLNTIVRKWLLNRLSSDKMRDVRTKILDDSTSPFWTRLFGEIKPNLLDNVGACETLVKKTLQTFRIGKIIVGHTPQFHRHNTGINGTCYQKSKNGDMEKIDHHLWRVDGGFSRAFEIFGEHTMIQVLEILDDTKFNILTEKITPIYRIKKPVIKP